MSTIKKPSQSPVQSVAKHEEKSKVAPLSNATASNQQIDKAGTKAVQDFLSNSAEETKRTANNVLNETRNQAGKLLQGAEKATRKASETVATGKENLDALMESGKVAAEISRELQEALVAEAKEIFNENVQLSKELLACRNFGDFAEVQSRAFQAHLTRLFDNTTRFSDAWFRLATNVAEPLTAQANQITEKFKKNIAA